MLLVESRLASLMISFFIGMFFSLSVLYPSFNLSLFSEAFAQSNLLVVKHRDLVIDLGDGVTTKAQLSYPAIGKGPFPGVLLIHGSGPTDMNGTLSLTSKPLREISDYISDRGFAVLNYDKRGIGDYGEIIDQNVWKNATVNELISDAKRALDVLIQQREVDPKKISIIGHSEGAIITTRIAVDNPKLVQNIVLMSVSAQNLIDILKFQMINNPLSYAHTILDKDANGDVSIPEIVHDNFLKYVLLTTHFPEQNDTESVTQSLVNLFYNNNITVDSEDNINIEKQIRPVLIASFKNISETDSVQCTMYICPKWLESHRNLPSTFDAISNISSTINILLLSGENDAQIPIKQALLIKQVLDGSGHPNRELKTYPNLGHVFFPSSIWQTKVGPIDSNVLADLFSWLEFHTK
jgi:uncharacterized protein